MHSTMVMKTVHRSNYLKSVSTRSVRPYTFTVLFQSEDISCLKKELVRGEEDLKRIGQLRDESLGRAWTKESLTAKYSSTPTEGLPSFLLPLRSRSSADLSLQSNHCKSTDDRMFDIDCALIER